jgi:ubiquinone/menaquinone biosynthesis C-methylase UbiE
MLEKGAEQTVEGWKSVASLYAEHIDPITGLYAEKALELVPVGEGDIVLDVATGAGALALRAAYHGANVTAVDFTPSLIKILEKRAEEAKLDNIQAEVMNGQDLIFDDDSFDTAFSIFGLMLFAERDKGSSELKRVLVPNGKAVVATWDAPPNNDWLELFQEVIHVAFPDMPQPKPPSFMELADTEQLSKEMSEAGFAEIDITSWATSVNWEDTDEAWTALAQANPIFKPLIEKIGPKGVAHLRSVFDDKTAERFGHGPVELQATAHFAIGTA